MRVIIDTGSKDEAMLVAAEIPGRAEAKSIRGYGLVATTFRTRAEAEALLRTVEEVVHEHDLRWVRVRYGEEERVFRSRAHRTS